MKKLFFIKNLKVQQSGRFGPYVLGCSVHSIYKCTVETCNLLMMGKIICFLGMLTKKLYICEYIAITKA